MTYAMPAFEDFYYAQLKVRNTACRSTAGKPPK